jgi:hypothetical protein
MPSNMHCWADRQRLVGAIEHSSTVRRSHLPDLRAKKSRSTVNCPILACSFSISRSRVASLSRPTPASSARPLVPAVASSRHRSGSGEPRSAGPDRPPSPAPAGFQRDLCLQRRVDLRSCLLRHHALRLSNGAALFITYPLVPKPGSISPSVFAAILDDQKGAHSASPVSTRRRTNRCTCLTATSWIAIQIAILSFGATVDLPTGLPVFLPSIWG